MSSPNPSRVAADRSTTSTISPLYITAMRSAKAMISSNSALTTSTATPSSRLVTICLWMNSIEPTSMPRVGWAAINSLTGRLNSRATTIFCWLPPERLPASVVTVGVRTSYSSTNVAAWR